LRFEVIDKANSFHADTELKLTEKYGEGSRFAKISKLENPSFLASFKAAVERVGLCEGARVLDLGINTADEFELLGRIHSIALFDSLELVGIDHCESALKIARERFASSKCKFFAHDINDLDDLNLDRFDLIISVGTLHSPNIKNSKKLFMSLVQEHMSPRGALILGFPNSRWAGGENIYGAMAKNYPHPEMSVLLGDIDFCKRYLNQHKFRVTLTGKSYIFLTATKI